MLNVIKSAVVRYMRGKGGKKIFLGFLALIFFAIPTTTRAVTYDTKIIYTTADAVVKSQYPDNNFAVGTQLWVYNSGGNKIRPYMYFDLSTIPANSTIITASVQVKSWLASGC